MGEGFCSRAVTAQFACRLQAPSNPPLRRATWWRSLLPADGTLEPDMDAVFRIADRTLVLQKGLVVLQGTADEVASSAALSGYLGV